MTTTAELARSRRPYVHATVVRAQAPTSARPGDEAFILDDGSIEGFVGGVCAESSVRAAALDALRDGNTVLLRVLPPGAQPFPTPPAPWSSSTRATPAAPSRSSCVPCCPSPCWPWSAPPPSARP
ncbi:XdhC family protein [Actinoplanes sp. URMC 104]|uniref:XdhC family protein n=1 Tax=Actinoplanes sp. URMC 104 TaxID=3423409 RepID=UPI003F1C8A49